MGEGHPFVLRTFEGSDPVRVVGAMRRPFPVGRAARLTALLMLPLLAVGGFFMVALSSATWLVSRLVRLILLLLAVALLLQMAGFRAPLALLLGG